MDLWEKTLTTQAGYNWRHRWRRNRLMSLGEVYEITDWCNQHCQDDWQVDTQNQEWRFDNDRDYVLFLLKWSNK